MQAPSLLGMKDLGQIAVRQITVRQRDIRCMRMREPCACEITLVKCDMRKLRLIKIRLNQGAVRENRILNECIVHVGFPHNAMRKAAPDKPAPAEKASVKINIREAAVFERADLHFNAHQIASAEREVFNRDILYGRRITTL